MADGESTGKKRVKSSPSEDDDGSVPQDEAEGSASKKVKFDVEEKEPSVNGDEQPEEAEQEQEPLDPRSREIEDLAEEFGEDKEDFEVVIGPNVNASSNKPTGGDSTLGEGQTAQAKRQENLPAFRFSASSLTAALWLPITAEQEEAMKVTGVTPNNYAHMINPGRTAKRRTVLEDDLDEFEHPKWRDPGAVQSDFFNYGLNEQTWKEYAARQVALRLYRLQQLQQGHQFGNESGQNEDEYEPH